MVIDYSETLLAEPLKYPLSLRSVRVSSATPITVAGLEVDHIA